MNKMTVEEAKKYLADIACDSYEDGEPEQEALRVASSELDRLAQRCEKMEKALRHIGYEQIGHPEAAIDEIASGMEQIARAALASSEVQQ